MRLEFKKIGGFLLGYPGWILEDDKVIYKNTEFYIDKMYNIVNMISPASYHQIMFHYDGNDGFHYDGKENLVCLHYDRDDESKKNGLDAYGYLLKKNGNKRKYIFNDFDNECIVDNEGIVLNGERIPYSSLSKFEEKVYSINGSNGSFTTEHNGSIIEIKYKSNDKYYAQESIKLANIMIENYNKYHNKDKAKEIISNAIEEKNNPRDYSKSSISKYIGLEEHINKLIDIYTESSKKIILDNKKDISKSVECFEKSNDVNDIIANYFINDYLKKLDQADAQRQKENKVEFAKDLLVDNGGDKFATIKEVKANFNCSTDEATDIVNKALETFESKERKSTRIVLRDNKNIEKRSTRTNSPKCPHCNSTNFRKISTTSKVVSTGILGLASSTIGKTFVCNKCGYKW